MPARMPSFPLVAAKTHALKKQSHYELPEKEVQKD